MEERKSYETEDDYQDEIDDLIKEIDRLYKDGTDKGFKLKREEEMEQEERALETEKECQDKLDNLGRKLGFENEKIKSLQKELNEREKIYQSLLDEVQDVVNIAKKKGFKYKIKWRSEETDFEARKQEILAKLEERALETEKDYQREYSEIFRQFMFTDAELSEAENELVRLNIEAQRAASKAKKFEQSVKKLREQVNSLRKQLSKLEAEAKKKGFKVRS